MSEGIFFIVSLTRAAKTAAPSDFAASESLEIFSAPTSGRAPSWINTRVSASQSDSPSATSAFSTLSERSAPPLQNTISREFWG